MRFTTTKLSLILLLTFIFFTPAFAITSIQKQTSSLSTTQPFIFKKQDLRVQKKEQRIQKFLKKRDISFSHPTDKWLWFGLVLLGCSVIMNYLPIIRIFASLIALVGIVFIFIWLFKKFV